KHMASLSLGFFERERSGRLVARVTNDAEAVEKLVTDELVRILAEFTFLAGAAAILFFLDVRLAAAAFSVIPFIVLATFAFQKKARSFYQDLRERVATVLSFFQETLRGVHVVRAFAQERTSSRQFEEVNDAWGTAKIGTLRLSAEYFARVDLLSSFGTATVLVYGGSRVLNGELSIGKLFAFIVFLALFFDPLHHLSERYTTFQSAMAGLARIAQLFQVEPEIVDHDNPVTLNKVQGNIAFQGTDFRYNRAAPFALQNVNIDVMAGTTLALVGPTGAGKSTFVKLLARFYDVSKGSILIDGLDIRRISLQSLRSHMALVPQEGFLFGGTIADNIRFGNPHASDSQIEQVCMKLGIDEFIRGLTEGYETQVRERGARLAAGERQLIALARALIADPSIILLDEATSSLDSATEARVQQAFRAALVGRTCVVSAHRLSTVMHADKIAVVEQGRIVEAGTHSELVSKQGRYADLYGSWLSGATATRV
ncbi:MAG: ABC transporter ATP-binding protein, partial [Actinomycetota bacterium]